MSLRPSRRRLCRAAGLTYGRAGGKAPGPGCPWERRFHSESPGCCLRSACCRRGWSGSASRSSTTSPQTALTQRGGSGCPPPPLPCGDTRTRQSHADVFPKHDFASLGRHLRALCEPCTNQENPCTFSQTAGAALGQATHAPGTVAVAAGPRVDGARWGRGCVPCRAVQVRSVDEAEFSVRPVKLLLPQVNRQPVGPVDVLVHENLPVRDTHTHTHTRVNHLLLRSPLAAAAAARTCCCHPYRRTLSWASPPSRSSTCTWRERVDSPEDTGLVLLTASIYLKHATTAEEEPR